MSVNKTYVLCTAVVYSPFEESQTGGYGLDWQFIPIVFQYHSISHYILRYPQTHRSFLGFIVILKHDWEKLP